MSSDDALLASMDEDIHRQTMFLSDLRTKRNFVLPIFRLLPEILEIIFINGARDYHESADGGRLLSRVPAWVNVSYVCRHWRNIALDCPALWTHSFNLSLRWTEELLLRSKQAPLKISWIGNIPSSVSAADLDVILLHKFLEHTERITELNLDLLRFPAGLSFNAPNLERLEIRSTRSPLVITDGGLPRLRTLKLVDCSLLWHSLNLSGLRTLFLSNVHSPSQLTMADFLALLRGMHHLSILYLQNILPSAHGFLGNSPQFNLPHLTRLAIAAPSSAVIALLSCVNIPLRSYLRLVPLSERGYTIYHYDPILSLIAQRSRAFEDDASSDQTLRSLVVDGRFPSKLTFSTLERHWECSSDLGFDHSGYHIPLEVILGGNQTNTIGLGITESERYRIMSNICCSLPLTNVQTLHVIEPHRFSSDFWKEVLGRLGGLRYMKLSGGFMPHLSLLSLRCKDVDVSQSIPDQDLALDHVFVPELEELELHQIAFTPEDAMWGRGTSRQSFFDSLSTRKRLKDRVTMIDCRDDR